MTAAKTTAPAKTPGRKPPAKKPAAKISRAAAQKAIADQAAKPRKSAFRGIALELPAQMPAAFAFDIAEVEESLAAGEGLASLHRLMVGFMGAEQWRAVRQKITDDGQSIEDLYGIVGELMESITKPYGIDPGKSEASATP